LVFEEQVARGREIFLEVSNASGSFVSPSVDRNGYVSLASSSGTHRKLLRLIVCVGDDTTGSAIEMQPSLGLGPTPYTWS
jgi:hypothetical protein